MPPLGEYRHLVTLEIPGPAVLDAAGGYRETWAPLTPATWHCSITTASVADLERIGGGMIATTATYLIRGRYHAELLTAGAAARIRWGDRIFEVASVHDRQTRGIELEVLAREILGQGAAPAYTTARETLTHHGVRETTH